MNFKMNHIQIVFEKSKIVFYLEDKKVGNICYDCEIYKDKSSVNKENFDEILDVLNKEVKDISKGFIFRPTLTMDVKYIDKSNFSEIHKQFFTELGLCLPVRNFELNLTKF